MGAGRLRKEAVVLRERRWDHEVGQGQSRSVPFPSRASLAHISGYTTEAIYGARDLNILPHSTRPLPLDWIKGGWGLDHKK